jgi:hypothetical protein
VAPPVAAPAVEDGFTQPVEPSSKRFKLEEVSAKLCVPWCCLCMYRLVTYPVEGIGTWRPLL